MKVELKELTDQTLRIFESDNVSELGKAIMKCVEQNQIDKMDKFYKLVSGDLTKDWMQMIYQYYNADRKQKKQDYTPKCIAEFMSMLCGQDESVVDLCAGSGALTIQKWNHNPDQKFILYELDGNVIPFLLFNLSIRNIQSIVFRADVLNDEVFEKWKITRGEKYGNVTYIKPAI